MVRKSRVGITGVSADRSWRTSFNLPVAQGLAGLELANVASASQSTAGEAAKVFRATPRYADGKDLIKGPAVHIVTIAVRVPEYRELVLAALLAGKHTYFEWPLGRNRAEMQELTTTAKAVGMRANMPDNDGKYPVIITLVPYAKGLSFQTGYKGSWDRMVAAYPEIEQGTLDSFANWELVECRDW